MRHFLWKYSLEIPKGLKPSKFDLQQFKKVTKFHLWPPLIFKSLIQKVEYLDSSKKKLMRKENPIIYVQTHENDIFIILVIYVYDGIMVTPKCLLAIANPPWNDFEIIYEGDLHSIVGLWIIWDQVKKWLFISQDKYLHGVLH
jgi:hypothetical protein